MIEAQWETILRLIVSLKQKHEIAYTVLKRFDSYSQYHPLHLALRELGWAVHTECLLRNMDNQLDKLESTYQFDRAVFYGQNGQFC